MMKTFNVWTTPYTHNIFFCYPTNKAWEHYRFIIDLFCWINHPFKCLLISNVTPKANMRYKVLLYVPLNTRSRPSAQLWMENFVEWGSSNRKCNLAVIERPHDHLQPIDMIFVAIWGDKSKGKSQSMRHTIQSHCWSAGFPCPLAALLSFQAVDICTALFWGMIVVIINSRMPWLEHATISHLHLCLSAGPCLAVHSCGGALVRVGTCWLWFLWGVIFREPILFLSL